MAWLIGLGLIAMIVACIWDGLHILYYKKYWLFLIYIPIFLCFWLLVLFGYNRALDYQSGKCQKWSQETGYETKYVNIGYGDWNCYGKTKGKWLPIERIRGIED